ncbi:MAG: XRE family transcriptional regulator [Rickettsiales bacterium TMED254]|nr:XRE family transcriptional regulator [Rickettsiales bacterium]RPF77240.1 MAG: XRE family transcriptional regulator [Rickettsiales bacterium TMED254]
MEINTNIGVVIRRLRREKMLTQKNLADQLGISVAYINLIENNRRSITVPLLLKTASLFNIELSELTNDYNKQLNSDLMDIFSDNIFEEHELKNNDIKDFSINSPIVGDAIRTLYDKYTQNKKDLVLLADQMISVKQEISDTVGSDKSSADFISDMLQSNNNYFNEIEDAASKEIKSINYNIGNRLVSMIEHLKKKFSISVDFIEQGTKDNFVKKFISEKKILLISNTLNRESKEFLIAHQIGLLGANDIIEYKLQSEGVNDKNTLALGKTVLANYFASCILMPYDLFCDTAIKYRYDIDILSNRFDTSFEQVCHRLTTLQKPNKKGIPFHFMRVDIAGNVSKRFSLSGLKIPRYSVACPRWNVYTAFLSPGKIKVQLSKMLDGKTFICIARTVSKRIGDYTSPETFFSIGLGFDIKYKEDCIYADRLEYSSAIPTGLSCRTCERENCRQRAFPPIHKNLTFNENVRGLSGYITPDK